MHANPSVADDIGADLLGGLNPEQRQAVTTVDGPVLIVAGPGSGKTRVLTVRVAWLVREREVAPWNILAVTFTNKAAREMRERIEQLVGDRARWITIGTFHAFCARTLRRYGEELGIDPRFVIYDDSDQMGIAKQALSDLDINAKQFSPRSILSTISKAKSQGLTPSTYARGVESYWEEVVARVYPVYQEALERRHALDFDDLLLATVRLLRAGGPAADALRDRYRYILVDEYQDTNRIQYELVKELAAAHRNLCVVGDPDQSIYGWRAADIRNILTFREDYPEAVEIHLEENYRSTPQILTAADAVIRVNTQRIDRRLRTSNVAGPSITIRECYDENEEGRFVVGEIMRLQAKHGYRGRQIAVLYRTNAQSRPIEEAFIRAGVPYQLIGGTRFYERKEIRDVLALLRVIANPDDAAAFQRVIAEFPLGDGIGAKSIAEIERWCTQRGVGLSDALNALGQPAGPPASGRAIKLLRVVHAHLTTLREIEPRVLLSELFDQALESTGYSSQFEGGDPAMAERWENVQQLRGHIKLYDDLSPEERLTTFLEEVALVSDADTIEDDRDRVTLITLHAVKGLEFDVVFITGVEEGLIPHQRSVTENPAMLEEERRLFYVGITRAKQHLYLSWAFRRTRYNGPALSERSSFMNVIPREVLGLDPTRASGRTAMSDSAPVPKRLEPSAPPPVVPVSVGQRVFHTRFGEGTVLETIDKPNDQEVTIEFRRHGVKKLLNSMANLTAVTDGEEGTER